jgi:hypothetical protein
VAEELPLGSDDRTWAIEYPEISTWRQNFTLRLSPGAVDAKDRKIIISLFAMSLSMIRD